MAKTYPATLDKLYEMLAIVRSNAEEAGFDQIEVVKIELAVEEALVNIINYGYPNSSGSIIIDVEADKEAFIRFIIQDQGIPYNPLTNSIMFDPQSPLEARAIGGYGIFFILKIMDDVKYKRKGGYNILTLTKYFPT